MVPCKPDKRGVGQRKLSGPGVFQGTQNKNFNEKGDNKRTRIIFTSDPYNFHIGPGPMVFIESKLMVGYHIETIQMTVILNRSRFSKNSAKIDS